MSGLSFGRKNSKARQTENLTDKVTDKVSSVLDEVEKKHGKWFWRTLEVMENYQESTISVYAGHTAFFLILSAFPFFLFFFALLDLTPLSEADFLMWASQLVPESLSGAITELTSDIYQGSSGGVISATIVTALWLSSKAFVSLQQGLNVMYKAKETRNYILMRIYGVAYSVVLAVLLLVILGILVFGNRIRDHIFPGTLIFERLVNWRLLICIPLLFGFFLLLYVFLPNRKQRVKNQIIGALFSAGAWVIFSYFFSIYVDKYSNYVSFYGAMATIALIMVWLYGCMYVLFLGGLINSILERGKSQ
jgi:membrane protein